MSTRPPYILLLLLFTMLGFRAGATDSLRVRTSLNEGWAYRESSLPTPEALEGVPAETVNLPHTWNRWDAVDNSPGYRRDVGWYSRTLHLRPGAQKRYLLYFEGANTKAEVYVNGQRAGGHVGGYVGWEVELTDLLDPGGDNRLDVRVDNGYDPDLIPSQKSDFFIYGGLIRDVWLREVPQTYLRGLQVSTPEVSGESATTTASIEVSGKADGARLRARILFRQ